MKIALLEAAVPTRTDRIFYPLGLAYCAAYGKKCYPDLEVAICRDLEELLMAEPDLVGISTTSPAFRHAVRCAEEITRIQGVPVILGGAHISGLPESLPPVFAAAVLGEGEVAFAALVKIFREKGKLEPSSMAGIPGLAVPQGSRVALTAPAAPLANLDSLPFPLREWKGVDSPLQWSFSSRGCPFQCIFCASSTIWKGYRAHSPGYVIGELKELITRFGLTFCIFMDDLFAVDIKRVRALSSLIKESLDKAPQLTVTLRADNASAEMCELLRNMGVNFVHLGLESGSERIVKTLKCGTTSVQVNQQALFTCREAGLNAVGSFILGAPGEEEEDFLATYAFISENLKEGLLKGFSFSPMVAFPGTAIWKEAVRKGVLTPSTLDWESLDIDIRSFTGERYLLLSEHISRARFMYHVERVRDLFLSTLPAQAQ
jgi:anaerobic magnesium-protoporphyrin IX monomethyl ester cyclase